jgi:hypothetical protein
VDDSQTDTAEASRENYNGSAKHTITPIERNPTKRSAPQLRLEPTITLVLQGFHATETTPPCTV